MEATDKILVEAQTVLQEALEAAQDLKIILEVPLLQVKDTLEETLQLIMSEVLEAEVQQARRETRWAQSMAVAAKSPRLGHDLMPVGSAAHWMGSIIPQKGINLIEQLASFDQQIQMGEMADGHRMHMGMPLHEATSGEVAMSWDELDKRAKRESARQMVG